jgi:hypothetical protein
MAAWDIDTEFKKSDPLSLLPGWHDRQAHHGYIGSQPNNGGPYIDISYDNRGPSEDNFSKTKFFDHASTLYEYLYRLKGTTNLPRKRADISEGILDTQAALHSLAKMTSEMARFDPYRQALYLSWEKGILSNIRPGSQYDWGPEGSSDKRMPPFSWAFRKWSKCTVKAKEDAATKKPSELKYEGVSVTQQMAIEMLGANGSRWRQLP